MIELEERKHCIYMITSPRGKSYVGQTLCFRKRMWAHRKVNSGCTAVSAAIQKYGLDNMKVVILLKNLTQREKPINMKNFILVNITLLFPMVIICS